jgi:uncharacterized protein YktB (UPF0637 family)
MVKGIAWAMMHFQTGPWEKSIFLLCAIVPSSEEKSAIIIHPENRNGNKKDCPA